MKIAISYPPLESLKGVPLLTQNRQFQWFKKPTYIYPVVPAQAATLLKENGFEVIWDDAIAEKKTYQKWLSDIKEAKPDIIVFETKTPVIKQHWKIINEIKGLSTKDYQPLTVLMGDHVTAFPEESFQNSKVDFVITGGDYDFLLLNLCKRQKGTASFEPGIYYREKEIVQNTGQFKLNHDLDQLPFIDRDLTKWQLYAYENGNYKCVPGTYTMAGRDCWWAKCRFCSWTTTYPTFRVRQTESLLNEIGQLIDKYDVKEIMDDTGTFPTGGWLREFCKGMIERGYNKKINLDCNMRFNSITEEGYKLMKKANFRLLLFGIESGNQYTLDRIDKGVKIEEIIDSCKMARRAGLYPHITIMFGYPWETYKSAKRTLQLGRWLLRKGYAYTVQATVVIPYPGTPLFEECKQHGWLKTLDWDYYDMKQPVMSTQFPEKKVMKLVRGIYGVAFNPEFILRRLITMTSPSDFKFFMRGAARVMGHLFDFKSRHSKCASCQR
jgi:radical SAM superfamily enzyme YgiQ (UPF0313 family)